MACGAEASLARARAQRLYAEVKRKEAELEEAKAALRAAVRAPSGPLLRQHVLPICCVTRPGSGLPGGS